MSESNETSPSLAPDCSWVQFCQRNAQPTATTGATTSPSHGLSPEGRVAKPARRRPRASRRTPATVFNTDPSNFRAMVQQFTGGGLGLLPPPPPSPFSFPGGTAAAGLGFRFGAHQVLENLINFPQRAASNHSMYFEPPPAAYTSPLMTSSGGGAHDPHTQPFLGRVSFPSPHHGGSASSSGLE
ncbi:unnamed protein product [Cuscuta epithymum]|uniref:VQ domain-containing protein n=1 Tax=Cuscuta epithymum TaxID=186058 RepID=A0AAV0E1R9_9ASTE|nr:unnamed protein product [Cuscuta epithymum]